jgi:hypothetical protein
MYQENHLIVTEFFLSLKDNYHLLHYILIGGELPKGLERFQTLNTKEFRNYFKYIFKEFVIGLFISYFPESNTVLGPFYMHYGKYNAGDYIFRPFFFDKNDQMQWPTQLNIFVRGLRKIKIY